MAGPDHKSTGGGANYQCLSNDPEYDPQALSSVPFSKLRSVLYNGFSLFSPNIEQHQVPCTVCETDRRITKLMITVIYLILFYINFSIAINFFSSLDILFFIELSRNLLS